MPAMKRIKKARDDAKKKGAAKKPVAEGSVRFEKSTRLAQRIPGKPGSRTTVKTVVTGTPVKRVAAKPKAKPVADATGKPKSKPVAIKKAAPSKRKAPTGRNNTARANIKNRYRT